MPPEVNWLELGGAARAALGAGRAVVALETTIVSHGMPWPRNLETALAVQQAVREEGAEPAAVAAMNGRLKVGLSERELEALARRGRTCVKCSRRDIPFVLLSGEIGATTVAATMFAAALAGIRVFATGGIGGVHRGAGASMDVSADLQELARSPVAVVCAGPKAILDIGLTREYLETHGVPLIGYRTERLPAFYTRDSGFSVDHRLDSAEEIAGVLKIQWDLGLGGGAVIANPVPEAHALDAATVEAAIGTAIREAEAASVCGRDLTPFLLSRLEQLTGGASLETNVALAIDNARLAARIAQALCAAHDLLLQ